MANNIANYEEDKLLDHSLGTTEHTFVTTIYVALYTDDPTDADSGTEVTGGSYARVGGTFASASGGSTYNSSAATFATASAAWGVVTHVGIRDALTAGNLKWHGPVTVTKDVGDGDTFEFAVGELDVSLN